MVARAIPGLGMGLNPYIDPNAAVTASDPSEALMPTGSALGNGIGSWLGALGMALLSSPRQSPFQTLPQIMPAMMQQQMQQAALAQQAGIWNAGIKAFGQAPGLDSLFPAGGAPAAPTMPNIGSGQTPQYPDTGMPNMSAGGALGKISDPRNKIPVIQQAALKYGIDPVTAVKVAASEGLKNPVGDSGMSHGAFQLFLGGGEGNNFARDTGLDPTDPNNEDATIDYAMRRASQVGWAPWNGAKRIGLSRWAGIGQASAAAPAVQMAQAGPQTMTDASSRPAPILTNIAGATASPVPTDISGANPMLIPTGQPDQSTTAYAQYTPDEIAKYRAAGLPLSPQSGQQAIQNQNGQAPSATAGSVSPSYARSLDGPTGDVARTAPQSLPDGTPQRPSTLAQAQTGPGPGPTPLQQQQALAAVQRPPPPSPDTVSGGLASQRAAAMRYYEYYGNLALRLAPFGEAGKTFADLAMKRMDIAKDLLTEDQKKRLDLQYAQPLAAATASGQHAGALPYLPAEKQIEQQAQYYGPGADVALQGQLAKVKEDAAAAANMREHFATQQGATMVDPNNPAAGVAPIPNFSQINAANKGAEAAAVSTANLPAQIGQATGSEYAKLGGEELFKRRAVAQDAAESLRQNQVARDLIRSGINSGPFAQWKQSFDRVLGDNNIASNTEAFVAARASEVGRLIKQFGSGTGLSDADREYAAAMAAGKIGLTKDSILKTLEINERTAHNILDRYNQDAAKVPAGLVPFPLTVQPSQTTATAPIVTPYGTIRQIR